LTARVEQIPLFVLTGFLGSGKTTLLARTLRHPGFARTAVIINEMGEIGLDHELVQTSSESLIELETGCLCCAVRGDLAVTLCDLLNRRDSGSVMPFERIVIETSGIADPAPILQLLMTDEGLRRRLNLAGVTTTVDATTALATLEREPQAPRQIAVADRLVITKTDLAGGLGEPLTRALRRISPSADLLIASHGDLDPNRLFVVAPWEPARVASALAAWLPEPASAVAEATSADHAGVTSLSLRLAEPLHAATLTLLVEALAEHCGEDLLRLKGIVRLVEVPDRLAVIHGVQHVFHPVELLDLDGRPGENPQSRLVLIGRRLDRGWIEALIQAIEAEVSEAGANSDPGGAR